MCCTEGTLMKYSNFKSNAILNQRCVLGKETDLLPVCLVKDGFIPLNLKRVCLEMTWARLIIYISVKCEKHRKPVWPELGQNPNQSHANHNNIQIFTGGAKALTWINLVFPHFFEYIKPSKQFLEMTVLHLDRMEHKAAQLGSFRYSNGHYDK